MSIKQKGSKHVPKLIKTLHLCVHVDDQRGSFREYHTTAPCRQGSPQVVLHWTRSNIKPAAAWVVMWACLLFLTQLRMEHAGNRLGVWGGGVAWHIKLNFSVPLEAGAKIKYTLLALLSCEHSEEIMNEWCCVPSHSFRSTVDTRLTDSWHVSGNMHDSVSQRQLRTD